MYCNFRKVEKKLFQKLFFYFIRRLLILIVWLKKIMFFFRFCLCIFESDTIKSDCPVQIFRKMMKYLKITLLVLLFFWRY